MARVIPKKYLHPSYGVEKMLKARITTETSELVSFQEKIEKN